VLVEDKRGLDGLDVSAAVLALFHVGSYLRADFVSQAAIEIVGQHVLELAAVERLFGGFS
jgi:hypothetical protein